MSCADGSMQAKIDLATFLPLTPHSQAAGKLQCMRRYSFNEFTLSDRFKMGGIYHLCYSDDGSFDPGHTDIVPQRIEVRPGDDMRCSKSWPNLDPGLRHL